MLTVSVKASTVLISLTTLEIFGAPMHCFRCLDWRSNELPTELYTNEEAVGKQLSSTSHDRESLQLESTSVSSSTGSDAIEVGVPIIGAAVVIAVFLGIIKLCYLKQRRIKTIHEIPVSLEAALLDEDKSSELSTPVNPERPLSITQAVDASSHRASQRSSFFSRSSQRSRSRSHSHSRRSSALTGILVGMLGSPDWETDMQRRMADHVWRERVASRSAGTSSHQNRHSWHAAASLSSDESRRNSRFSARSGGNRMEAHSRRAYSARIPHISSFGEIGLMPIARRRPNSHNGVCNANRADNPNQNSAFLSPDFHQDSRTQGTNDLSPQYPVLREVSTPSTSTVTDYGTAPTSLRIHITDYSDDALTRPQSVHIANLGSENSTPASSPFIGQSVSEGSSATSSWGQLPNFPSPPLTPASPALASPNMHNASNFVTINNVLIAPYALEERIYSADADLLLGKYQNGLGLLLGREESFPKLYADNKEARGSHSSLLNSVGWPYTAFSSSLSLPLHELEDESSELFPDFLEEIKEPKVNVWEKPLKARHLKVLNQIPTALVAPPKAYLQPLRLPDDIDTTAGNSFITFAGDTSPSPISTFAPTRPSPLRKLASLDSITLSPKSVPVVEGIVEGESPSNPQPLQHAVGLRDDSKFTGQAPTSSYRDVQYGSSLVRKESRTSNFLDLSGCSAGGESTDFFSFDSSSYDIDNENGEEMICSRASSTVLLDLTETESIRPSATSSSA